MEKFIVDLNNRRARVFAAAIMQASGTTTFVPKSPRRNEMGEMEQMWEMWEKATELNVHHTSTNKVYSRRVILPSRHPGFPAICTCFHIAEVHDPLLVHASSGTSILHVSHTALSVQSGHLYDLQTPDQPKHRPHSILPNDLFTNAPSR